jgi:hypothetical protein
MVSNNLDKRRLKLTSHTDKELPRKSLNVRVGKGHKIVPFEKVKQAESKQICHDADMPSEVEAVTQMDTPVPILSVVFPQSL